jgi:BirA family biotin operon repressor/biotin-[acetyl-CoA-carboxylase] ligase
MPLSPPRPHAAIERFRFDELDSTNAFAGRWMRLASGASEAVILSRVQTAGRGQHGREWSTEAGRDLAWSYARRFGEAAEELDLVALNMAWSVAILEAVERQFPVEMGLKWPNDLYARTACTEWRKLGGLLIEAQWRGSGCAGVVLGVGLNVQSTRKDAAWPAVSLQELGSNRLDVEDWARVLESAVRNAWSQPFDAERYRARLLFRGARRTFEVNGERMEGAFMDALDDGRGRFEWATGPAIHEQGSVRWCWDQG